MLGVEAQIYEKHDDYFSPYNLVAGMTLLDDVAIESGQLLLKTDFTLSETSIKILLQWHAKDPIVGKIKVKVD
jgi:hypothetical protein